MKKKAKDVVEQAKEKLALEKTWLQIAREETTGRDITDADLDGIIWEHTGFPAFWALKPGESVEQCFRRQLREYFDAL